MSSPTRKTALLALLETLLHRVIQLDRAKCAGIKDLSGSVFLIEITEPKLTVYLIFGPRDYPRVSTVCDETVTTAISGKASDFVELALAEDPSIKLVKSPLEISGETHQLLALHRILKNIDLDWEAPLAKYLGDILGHQLAKLLRSLYKQNGLAGESLSRQLEEYIHEEARLCPPKLELEDFYGKINKLTLTLDRLAFRLKTLQSNI